MNPVQPGCVDAASTTLCSPATAAHGWPPRILTPSFGTTPDAWVGLSRDLIERFIEVNCLRHDIPRSTRRGYRGDLVAFDHWMWQHHRRTLVSARGSDLRGFLATRVETGIEVRLLQRLVTSLQHFFQYLHESGSRSDNPARRLRQVEGTRKCSSRRSSAVTR